MNMDTVEIINKLDHRIKLSTEQFHNSAVAATTLDPVLGHVFGEIRLTVFDLLFLSILSQVHVLITGPTGCGKSALAKLICSAIFGRENKNSEQHHAGWFLKRLNPHLTEEKFANFNFNELKNENKTLRDAVKPAHFLRLPCTILDELNRCPPALTNILFGFCDPEEPELELLCGVKYDVGYKYQNSEGNTQCYHMVIGTMNEGKEYTGIFDVDPALRRRFTLEIPFGHLRPTPLDIVNIVENKIENFSLIGYDNMCEDLVNINKEIIQLPLDPLAFTYLLYLANIGRCPHFPGGYRPKYMSQDVCIKTECRVLKNTNHFCPSVSGLPEGVWKFLNRACCGLAALRATRIIQAINKAFDLNEVETIEKLKTFTNLEIEGIELQNEVISKYLEMVSISASDIKALIPYAALGGKIWIEKEYVTKHYKGSYFQALQNYTQLSYSRLESIFRDNRDLFEDLQKENGAFEELVRRLEHAEHFNDPCIRHAIEPLLKRQNKKHIRKEEIECQVQTYTQIQHLANKLVE